MARKLSDILKDKTNFPKERLERIEKLTQEEIQDSLSKVESNSSIKDVLKQIDEILIEDNNNK